ncbi:hypothetical protein CH379_000510 [Leptospira ellisii]|uniref:Uncharacterized protein n=1 Tax=Leptospira ellisii TaxID=2023197 RepID=A0A2N0B6U9_9LEPT|nr:hypothetical protein [Leptospira ellisii]MDV6234114.1 hypothetical protein [Leptospira ellisii]PJZ92246.1 hypothetical protein CH379_14205 [Leptospira ellisii]PKA02448.1 hypothetical protein CH375_23035 [Leptospira ellisii]
MENHISVAEAFSEKFLTLLTDLRGYRSPFGKTVGDPSDLIQECVQKASIRAGAIGAGLSISKRHLGYLTLLPEMILFYRIQGHLVKDIAALYGKETQVTPEIMSYCIFPDKNHALIRSIVRDAGSRFLVRPATLEILRSIGYHLGWKLFQRNAGGPASRYAWLPYIGALLNGGISFLDTKTTGRRAQDLFRKELEFYPGVDE